MTIYQTFFDPEDPRKMPIDSSADCGLETLQGVEDMMGEPLSRDKNGRYLVYPDGLCFSTIRFA